VETINVVNSRFTSLAGFGLLSFCVQGCDFVGGLVRVAELEGALNDECVLNALQAVDGVSNVRYAEDDYGYHRFEYSVAGIENKLIYEVISDDEVRYWNDYSLLNSVPELEDIRTMRPYLYEIDRGIEVACGVSVSEVMIESCSRIDCR